MANTIRIKRSSVPGKVPLVADLVLGEMAINTHDGVLYIKRDNTSSGGSESVVAIGQFGYTGSQGYSGSQGYTGSRGSTGFTGSQGIQGSIGFTGSQGIQGIQGIQGFTGSQGVIGFTGSQGIQGIQGVIGYTGSQGIQGVQGLTGYTGSQGVIGYTGSQGVIGYTGSRGFTGSQGNTGFTGSQGAQGLLGYTGSQGSQGNVGFTGSQGIQGVIGYTGSQGTQGVTGYTGSKGDIGYTGSLGYTGSRGPATAINATDDSTSTTLYPVFVGAAGSEQVPKVSISKIAWNAATGNLGIGITAPLNKLDVVFASTTTDLTTGPGTAVNTGIRVLNTNTTVNSFSYIDLRSGNSSDVRLASVFKGANLSDFVILNDTGNTALTEQFRITSDGNVGIGTSNPSSRLHVAGNVSINSVVNLSSELITLATVSQSQIASFATASFRSAKLLVQVFDSVTSEVQISELLVAHNGTSAFVTEYGVVYTGASALATFDVDIGAGNVRLLATRATSNSTQYKVSETLLAA